MTKAPIALQELRRRIYCKAKSEKAHRFWGIFVHVTRKETLEEAYQETNKRMRDNAARVSRALCRARVVAEMYQRRGTQIAEHLTLVLWIIDRQQER
jgi:predicted ribosome quality control (RQC) complex YloA/Tae2 family protein